MVPLSKTDAILCAEKCFIFVFKVMVDNEIRSSLLLMGNEFEMVFFSYKTEC